MRRQWDVYMAKWSMKIIDQLKVEQENDLLVCGDCQTKFPLQDILIFIKHKIKCNKENNDLAVDTDFDYRDDGDTESSSCISSKRPSISAPLSQKELLDNRLSPRTTVDSPTDLKPCNNDTLNIKQEPTAATEKNLERQPLKPRQVQDAESNTSHSEPSKFMCVTCKSAHYTSAWGLLQHVQKEHGIKIYHLPSGENQFLLPQRHRDHREHRDHMDHRDRDSITPLGSNRESPIGPLPPQNTLQHQQHHPFLRIPPFEKHSPSPAASVPFNSRPQGSHDFSLDHIVGDPFRPRPIFPLSHSPLDHVPTSQFQSQFERPRSLSIDPHGDYYSETLRRLASASSLGPLSPLRKTSPPFTQAGSNILTLTTQSSPSDIQKRLSPTNKLKSCEFCGKAFRFQSNLIVHRRSHTGEKPYKCPKCPHACTQQSKLKRHMKTHFNKSPLSHGSDGSMPSCSSSPDSTKHNYKDVFDVDNEHEEEMDEDGEEIDDEDELEEEREDENMDEEDEDSNHCRSRGIEDGDRDSSLRSNKSESDLNSLRKNDDDGDVDRKSLSEHPGSHYSDSRRPSQISDSSHISDVMGASGLRTIQPFSEAIEQAIAENFEKETEKSTSEITRENGLNETERGETSHKPENNTDRDRSGMSSPRTSPDSKGVKLEPSDSKGIIKQEPSEHMNNADVLYPRLPWYAPPTSHQRDPAFYGIMHGIAGIRNFGLGSLHNLPSLSPNMGYRIDRDSVPHNSFNHGGPTNESALRSISGPKTSTNLTGTPPSSNGSPMARKDRTRNDTCEYCGKIFRNCSNLTVHRRSHTGEKPYKCHLCNYACAQSSKLTRHMKTHGRIGKETYLCKFCEMPFSVPSTLEKHMRKCVSNNQDVKGQEADTSDSNTGSNVGCDHCINDRISSL